jgi:ABC-type Fe3+ transport system substrate-binding protein
VSVSHGVVYSEWAPIVTMLITVLHLGGEDKGWEYWKQFHRNVWQSTKSVAQYISFITSRDRTIVGEDPTMAIA